MPKYLIFAQVVQDGCDFDITPSSPVELVYECEGRDRALAVIAKLRDERPDRAFWAESIDACASAPALIRSMVHDSSEGGHGAASLGPYHAACNRIVRMDPVRSTDRTAKGRTYHE